MKVLSNPDRLMILYQLSKGELAVGEKEDLLGIGQPTLSQRLTVWRDEEQVQAQRMGKSIDDQLKSPKALTVIGTFYKHYCKS